MKLSENKQERLDDALKNCRLRMKELGLKEVEPITLLRSLLLNEKPDAEDYQTGMFYFGTMYEDLVGDQDILEHITRIV